MKALKNRLENLIFSFTYIFSPNTHNKVVYHLDYENKEYRQTELVKIIRDSITHFELTPSEFEDLNKEGDIGEMERIAWGRISKAKKFKKGDYGELLLFIILLIYHNSPKFVTKVRLRSSVKEQIKGFDCAHFTMENNEPILWLGEAKFHKNFGGALFEAVESINSHFVREYLKDEISILYSNIEINKDFNLDELRKNLQGKSLDKIKFRVPILLTYDSKTIKDNIDSMCNKFKTDIEAEMKKNNISIEKKQFSVTKNTEILFIIFPLHTVEKIKTDLDNIENIYR